jgi:hypothetical protein
MDTIQALPVIAKRPNLMTVRVACQRYKDAFPNERVLRNLIFKARDRYSSGGVIKGNGLDVAIIRVGRKILIDEDKLIGWIYSQSMVG